MARRSQKIDLKLVTLVASAAVLNQCGSRAYHRDWQQCVDQNNVVVEDRLCDQPQPISPSPFYHYHWLYSPSPFGRGATVIGGYNSPRPNMSIARSSSASAAEIARGGFGSSAGGKAGAGS